MEIGEEEYAATEDQEMMPGMDVNDPLTFDPTQEAGTPAWQETKRRQAEINERLGINAHFRRN